MSRIEISDMQQLMAQIGQTPVVNRTPTYETSSASSESPTSAKSDFSSSLEAAQRNDNTDSTKVSAEQTDAMKGNESRSLEAKNSQENQIAESKVVEPVSEAKPVEKPIAETVKAQTAGESTPSTAATGNTAKATATVANGNVTATAINVQTTMEPATDLLGGKLSSEMPITLLGMEVTPTSTPSVNQAVPLVAPAEITPVTQNNGQALPTATVTSISDTTAASSMTRTSTASVVEASETSVGSQMAAETTVAAKTPQAIQEKVASPLLNQHTERVIEQSFAPTSDIPTNENPQQSITSFQSVLRQTNISPNHGTPAVFLKDALAAYRSVEKTMPEVSAKADASRVAEPIVDQKPQAMDTDQTRTAKEAPAGRLEVAANQSHEESAETEQDESSGQFDKPLAVQMAGKDGEAASLTVKSGSQTLEVGVTAQREPTAVQGAAKPLPAAVPSETMTARIERLRDLVAVTGKAILSKIDNGGGSIRLQLDPPHLGQVKMDIQVDRDGVRAAAIVENSQVKQVLLDNLPQLRQMFAERGLDLQRFDVFQQLPNQQQAQDFQAHSRSFAGDRREASRFAETTDRESQFVTNRPAVYALRGMSGNIRVRA